MFASPQLGNRFSHILSPSLDSPSIEHLQPTPAACLYQQQQAASTSSLANAPYQRETNRYSPRIPTASSPYAENTNSANTATSVSAPQERSSSDLRYGGSETFRWSPVQGHQPAASGASDSNFLANLVHGFTQQPVLLGLSPSRSQPTTPTGGRLQVGNNFEFALPTTGISSLHRSDHSGSFPASATAAAFGTTRPPPRDTSLSRNANEIIPPPAPFPQSTTSITPTNAANTSTLPVPVSEAASSTMPGQRSAAARKRDSGVAGLDGSSNRTPKRQRISAKNAVSSSKQETVDREFERVFEDSQSESDSDVIDLRDNQVTDSASEQKKNGERIRLGGFQCAICMDFATGVTVTHCGHLFCSDCLTSALAIENQKNKCPICRQKIENKPCNPRSKNNKGFYALELKLMTAIKKGKKASASSRR